MNGRDRTGVPVEGVGSSAPLTARPQPPTPIASAAVVLVWRDAAGLGHRLRARSWWTPEAIAALKDGPTRVAHERTVCGIDLPDHRWVTIEVDGVVDCQGCAGYARADHRLAVSKEEAVAA